MWSRLVIAVVFLAAAALVIVPPLITHRWN